MNNISDHITYSEATKSLTAMREGINNTPDEQQLKNMRLWAYNIFEPMRAYFGRPIKIASFFRCRDLNSLVGGSLTSDHMQGCAADIDQDHNNEGPTNAEIFFYVLDYLEFDQLIWEHGNDNSPDWVHIGYRHGANRGQVLRKYPNKSGYHFWEPRKNKDNV